jgi:rhamnosyl/mannosyltransferase
VVSTELGTGTSYVNLNEVTGLVVPPMDSSALVHAINRLLADSVWRQQLGNAGRQRAQQELSADIMVDRLVQMYRAVMDSS